MGRPHGREIFLRVRRLRAVEARQPSPHPRVGAAAAEGDGQRAPSRRDRHQAAARRIRRHGRGLARAGRRDARVPRHLERGGRRDRKVFRPAARGAACPAGARRRSGAATVGRERATGEDLSMDFRKFRGTDRYLTSSALESAVNCALALERPLLVRGEPGTGKTQLAEAIAASLGMRLIHWPVKSTTRAQDGLYVYDTVQRLYDSRFGEGNVKDIRRYIKYGPLGQAFAAAERVVLLIDEVDKADLEVPNDLLHELDRMRFAVGATGDEIVAQERPLVAITSNARKEIPDAFLRRHVFHF